MGLDISHAAVGLGKDLFPLFARALDLAPDFFDDKVRILLLADLHYHGLCGTALMMKMRRKLDAKLGCVDARAALPATDGADR